MFGSLVSVKPGLENFVAGFGKGMVINVGIVLAACGVLSLVNCAIREAQIKKVLTRFPVQVSLSPQLSEYFKHYTVGLSMAVFF